MNILIIEHEFPFPILAGRRMRGWCFFNALAEEHKLSLLCLDRPGSSEKLLDNIKQKFDNIWIVVPDKTKIKTKQGRLHNFINLLKGIPWDISAVFHQELEEQFLKIIGDYKFDIVFCHYIYAAQYIIKNRKKIKGRAFVDLDDIETLKWKRRVDTGSLEFKNLYDKIRSLVNYKIFERYHKRLRLLDGCFVCSQKDRDYVFSMGWTKNVSVIPNSIQVSQYKNVTDYGQVSWKKKVILFCGNLSYFPNAEGVVWLAKKVLPLLKDKFPEIRFHIVGLNPDKSIYPFIDNQTVFLFKNVPDVVPYYEESSLVISPIWAAGGTRIKILEAFACRRPVIATTIGAEGLGVESGKHCLISDTPEGFAAECEKLLSDFDAARRMTEEAFSFVKETYDIGVVQKQILKAFQDA